MALEGYKLQVERLTKIANSLQHFTNLCKPDRDALMKENADLIVSLNGALFFDKKKKGVDQVMSSMGHSKITNLIIRHVLMKSFLQRTEKQ